MSNRKPSTSKRRARPPKVAFFSKIVTSKPLSARLVAVASPANPAPITMIFFKDVKLVIELMVLSFDINSITYLTVLEYTRFFKKNLLFVDNSIFHHKHYVLKRFDILKRVFVGCDYIGVFSLRDATHIILFA